MKRILMLLLLYLLAVQVFAAPVTVTLVRWPYT